MSNSTLFGYPIPTARKGSPLRQRMIDDMTVRNFAPNTHISYLQQVNLLRPDIFGKITGTVRSRRDSRLSTLLGQRKEGVSWNPNHRGQRAPVPLRSHFETRMDRSIHSRPQEGSTLAGHPQPARSPATAASRSFLSTPCHLQHHVRHRDACQ